MTGTFVAPVQGKEVSWLERYQIYAALTGKSEWGRIITITSLDDDSNYAVTIRNRGTGGALNVQGSGGTSVLQVLDSGGVLTGSFAVSTTLTAATVTATTVNGTTGNIGTLNVTTALNAGDGNADAHTVVGVTTFRNLANTATQLYVDAGNNRVIVGSTTTLGSDTTPNLQVIGRLYVAPETANDLAIQVRRSSAASVGWNLGMTSDNDFVFKDDAGSETFRVGDTGSTYQAKVTGDLNVTQNIEITSGSLLAQTAEFLDDVTVDGGTFIVENSGNKRIEAGSTGVGFFGSAQTSKPTVVGSRAGNAALNSLLSELANLGLVTNSTTA